MATYRSKVIRIIFIIQVIFLVGGCSISGVNVHEVESIVVSVSYNKDKAVNTYYFMDDNNEVLGKESFTSKGDVSYSYLDHEFQSYLKMGPGGVYELSLDSMKVKQIDKRNINVIRSNNNQRYYYVNNGYQTKGYDGQICSITCLQIGEAVEDFYVVNDYHYVKTMEADVKGSTLIIYKDHEMIEKIIIEEGSSNFYEVNNQVLVVSESMIYVLKDDQITIIPHELTTFGYGIENISSEDTTYLYDRPMSKLYKVETDFSIQFIEAQEDLSFSYYGIPYQLEKEELIEVLGLKNNEVIVDVIKLT